MFHPIRNRWRNVYFNQEQVGNAIFHQEEFGKRFLIIRNRWAMFSSIRNSWCNVFFSGTVGAMFLPITKSRTMIILSGTVCQCIFPSPTKIYPSSRPREAIFCNDPMNQEREALFSNDPMSQEREDIFSNDPMNQEMEAIFCNDPMNQEREALFCNDPMMSWPLMIPVGVWLQHHQLGCGASHIHIIYYIIIIYHYMYPLKNLRHVWLLLLMISFSLLSKKIRKIY